VHKVLWFTITHDAEEKTQAMIKHLMKKFMLQPAKILYFVRGILLYFSTFYIWKDICIRREELLVKNDQLYIHVRKNKRTNIDIDIIYIFSLILSVLLSHTERIINYYFTMFHCMRTYLRCSTYLWEKILSLWDAYGYPTLHNSAT